MVYLSTTQYLSRKLNWMGRKLRFMNDATTIKEWTEAMDCVFKSLDTFSRNKDVSTPTQIWIKKMEIHRGQNINVLSLHVDSKIKEKVVKKPLSIYLGRTPPPNFGHESPMLQSRFKLLPRITTAK